MEIIFTFHAKDKMERRGLLNEEVLSAIKYPDTSEKKHGKYFFRKNIGRGTIMAIAEITEKNINIITVHWI